MSNNEQKTETPKTFGAWWDEIKKNRIVVSIPDYQRSYAWEERQVTTLLEDITEDLEDFYFLGMFLIEKNPDEPKKINLIDGQQRFTTLVMILKALDAEITIEDSTDNILKLQDINQPDLRNILSSDSKTFETQPDIKTQNQSSKKLYHAYKIICDFIGGLEPVDKTKIISKIMGSHIHTYTAEDTKKSMYIFELLNDRGKALSSLETIKSVAMYHTPSANPQEIDDIKASFTNINTIFEEILQHVPNIHTDEILRYHYIAYGNWTERTDYSGDKTRFSLKKELKENGNPVEYIQAIEETFETFSEIIKTVFNASKKSWIRALYLYNRTATFYPLLLKIKCPKNREIISKHIELYIFKAFTLLKKRSDADVAYFAKMAKEYKDRSEGHFETMKIDIVHKIIAISNEQDLAEAINHNKFYKRSVNDRNIILLGYEEHLKESLEESVSPEDIKNIMGGKHKQALTSEHIIPQDLSKIKNLKDRGFENEKELKDIQHSLGNLVISRCSGNSQKSNKAPEEKEWETFKSQYEIEESIQKNGLFGKKQIEERQIKIAEFIAIQWINIYKEYHETINDTEKDSKQQQNQKYIEEYLAAIESRKLLI